MTVRRKSTLAFARKHCADNPDIMRALDLPMVPEILDTMDRNRGSRFFLKTTTQIFKTLVGQLHAFRNVLVQSGDALWYSHPEKSLDKFADAKHDPLFDSIGPLQALLYDNPHKKARGRINYPCGSQVLLSAKVKLNRQGATARDLYLDESWTYEPGWCADISQRRSSFDEAQSWIEVYMSTGTIATTEADQIWNESTQRAWHMRCPACKELIAPRRTHKHPDSGEIIGGLIFDTVINEDGTPNAGAITANVRYQCPICRAQQPDTPGSRLAMNGTAQNPIGAYVTGNLSPSLAPPTFGWHVPAVCVKPWAALALRMVKAQLAKQRAGDLSLMEELILKEDADRWDPEMHFRPEKFARYQHPTPYAMREEWAGELKDDRKLPFRFALVDVQIDYYVLVIRKWGRFSQSRLHFAAYCLSPSEIALHCTREEVPNYRVFCDTRYNPEKIRTICAAMGWRTMMGDRNMKDYGGHEDGIRRIYDVPKPIDALTGTLHQGQSGGYVIETLFSKNSALNRLAVLRGEDSKAADGSPLWTAAKDAPEWYYQQINAHYRKRIDNADGSHHHVWHGQKKDHADDDEAMCVIAAAMAGLTGAEALDSAAETSEAPKKT